MIKQSSEPHSISEPAEMPQADVVMATTSQGWVKNEEINRLNTILNDMSI